MLDLAKVARNESDPTLALLRRSELPCPDAVPPNIWAKLSPGQRLARSFESIGKRFSSESSDLGLSESDFLRMTFKELDVSDRAADVITALVAAGCANEKNPTIAALVAAVNDVVNAGRPLECVISQCIAKAPDVRPAKLDYFTGRETRPRTIARFTAGLECKGWDKLSRILNDVAYPIQVTMLLGDMDLRTIDGAERWADAVSLDRLDDELRDVRNEVSRDARVRFGAENVTVRGWSEFYTVPEFQAAVDRAEDIGRWSDRALIAESTDLYKQYGYRRLQRELDIAPEVMDRFILDDVVRTAAQYRLEADIAARERAIQLWAESVPNKMWPIKISNYDGAGYAPAIVLV